MKKIIIVGEKNIFRSIIICECLKEILKQKNKNDYEVDSAGIFAISDIPIDDNSKKEISKLNINKELVSKQLNKEKVVEANLILTINNKIKKLILNKFPEKQSNIFTIKEFAGFENLDFEKQETTVEEAKDIINKFIDKI